MKWAMLVYIAMVSFSLNAAADVLTVCGESSGYGYYFPGSMVPADSAGMHPDGVTGGSIQLIRDGDLFDIVYSDTQGARSARADGFEVVLLGQNPALGEWLFVAVSPLMTVEHFLFQIPNGNGGVAWGTTRIGAISKSSLYYARCRRP
jgi:hypothetical protein